MVELPELWPDDIGAQCREVPDGISLVAAARDLSRERQSHAPVEWFSALVAAYWCGEFRSGGAGPPSAMYTPERLPTTLPRQGSEPLGSTWTDPDTLIRRPVYWAPEECAAHLARFWHFGDAPPPNDLPDLATNQDRLRWLAALPLDRYPPAAYRLLGRLHISRAALRRWVDGARPPRRRGGREQPYWAAAEKELMRWLDYEGEPAIADAARQLAAILADSDHHPAPSTLREHAAKCIERHRARRSSSSSA